MRGPANHDAVTVTSTHVPAADTAAVVTIAADAAEYWVIDSISYGYDKTPGGAETLTIAYGAAPTTKLTLYIPNNIANAGPHVHTFPRGFHNAETVNEQCVVTLSAATGTCKGTVTVTYH